MGAPNVCQQFVFVGAGGYLGRKIDSSDWLTGSELGNFGEALDFLASGPTPEAFTAWAMPRAGLSYRGRLRLLNALRQHKLQQNKKPKQAKTATDLISELIEILDGEQTPVCTMYVMELADALGVGAEIVDYYAPAPEPAPELSHFTYKQPPKPTVTRGCIICGVDISAKKSTAKFCGNKCSNKFHNNKKAA
jgi:hypothetical protein